VSEPGGPADGPRAAAGAPRAAVIGIGNPYRRDDGIGPALVAALARLRPPGVSLTVADGEPSQLLDAWSGAPLAVVVDTVLCEAPAPGRIHRTVIHRTGRGSGADDLMVPAPGSRAAASTHGLGIPDAVRLAEALHQAPARLVVMAVEAADIGFGVGLSPAVAACLPELTRAVLAEVAADHEAAGGTL
jgi:hydrogenase maturation protease